MREIVRGTQFKRDVKLAERRGKDMAKLKDLILLLRRQSVAVPLQGSRFVRRLEALQGLSYRA
jgi:mRNA-degrading endonuclease YafQ of YafQ-DinJ toxin-antitoxin module